MAYLDRLKTKPESTVQPPANPPAEAAKTPSLDGRFNSEVFRQAVRITLESINEKPTIANFKKYDPIFKNGWVEFASRFLNPVKYTGPVATGEDIRAWHDFIEHQKRKDVACIQTEKKQARRPMRST